MSTSPLKSDSRTAFEAEFRKQYAFDKHLDLLLEMYNHGTDEEPEIDYYSLAARDAWKWWQASRTAIAVELPVVVGDCLTADDIRTGINQCAHRIRAAGITVKGD